jgi:hypothetical protein
VDPHHLLARHGEHAERIVVPQVDLGGERKFRKIGKRLQIVWMHALFVKRGLVMRHVLVGMGQRPFHPLELQRGNLVARGGFNRVETCPVGRQIKHRVLLQSRGGGSR